MDRKKLLLLIGALVIAIGTALGARSLLASGAAAPQAMAAVPQAPQGPKVLVAQRALPLGTIITQDALTFQPWPKDRVQDAYFIEGQADMAKLLGTVVRFPVTAGQPVTQGALVKPGERGFLAAALGPGMRAVTITTSTRSGVGGFIFPGDRVDLLLTQTVSGNDDGQPLNATETVIRNLRVLATDQSTDSAMPDGKQPPEAKVAVKTFNTVTLEVTPRLAEKIAVAEKIGSLTLSLRSLADNQQDLDRPDANPLPDASPADSDTTVTTGGDVSRFQRSGMPRKAKAAPAPGTVRPTHIGSVVRVTRGKTTSLEPVG